MASAILLLLGVGAVAIDLSAGYNERRQDQTAADLGALSASLSFVSPTSASTLATSALAIVAQNLDTTFSAAEWEAAWSSCTDPGALDPVPAPTGWAATTLTCISSDFETVRVRVPDQIIETALAGAIGADEIRTSAVAEAKFQFFGAGNPKPFGLLNGLPAGETCLTQPATGQAMDSCDGNTSGNFGTLLSDTWGRYGNIIDCGTPGVDEVQLAVATGIDHPIGTIAPARIPGSGGAWQAPPAAVSRLDDCTVSGGKAVPSDNSPTYGPVNTMLASTGNNFAKAVEIGLITGEPADFGNHSNPASVTPLLKQIWMSGSFSDRRISQKVGPNQLHYQVDNTPLVDHLRTFGDLNSDGFFAPECDKALIEIAPIVSVAMSDCLLAYETSGSTVDLFEESIAENPRFGWAPQFHHDTWGSGSHWEPILRFRAIYVNRVWFNCNGKYGGQLPDTDACNDKGKGLIFEPKGSSDESDLKVGAGGSMKQLRMDQVTGFLLPIGSLPDELEKSFPGGVTGPFEVVLSK
jgi:hypothetical protein